MIDDPPPWGCEIALRSAFVREFDEPHATPRGRRVLHSGAHGRHSRPNLHDAHEWDTRHGYARSVAEAVADWWLLGEADLGVMEVSYQGSNSARPPTVSPVPSAAVPAAY